MESDAYLSKLKRYHHVMRDIIDYKISIREFHKHLQDLESSLPTLELDLELLRIGDSYVPEG